MLLFRISFEKAGLMKYISHLDLNRTFIRAINRAGIKIAYSEGYNPHPRITFASTLSLGVCSYCEFLDIKTHDGETAEKIFETLSKAVPNGINIKEVYVPEKGLKEINTTEYAIFIESNKANADTLKDMFLHDVLVEKKSKTKLETVDINKFIERIEFYDNCDNRNNYDGHIKIAAVLRTNSDEYLNPEYIIKAVKTRFEIDDYFIEKINMFDKDGNIFR